LAHDKTGPIIQEAALRAAKFTKRPYTIFIPDSLPPRAPTNSRYGLNQLAHLCLVSEGKASIDDLRRLDAAYFFLLRRIDPSLQKFDYFEQAGNKSGFFSLSEQLGWRRWQAARTHGYDGLNPMTHKLTVEMQARFDGHLKAELKRRADRAGATNRIRMARGGKYARPCPSSTEFTPVHRANF
jgi:hypothetical protein